MFIVWTIIEHLLCAEFTPVFVSSRVQHRDSEGGDAGVLWLWALQAVAELAPAGSRQGAVTEVGTESPCSSAELWNVLDLLCCSGEFSWPPRAFGSLCLTSDPRRDLRNYLFLMFSKEIAIM